MIFGFQTAVETRLVAADTAVNGGQRRTVVVSTEKLIGTWDSQILAVGLMN